MSSTCEFHSKDNEILAQIIQGCTSSRVRRRALRDNYTLEKLIEETRALELSENRATEMESSILKPQTVNTIHQPNRFGCGSRGRSRGHGRVPHGGHGRAPQGRSRGASGNRQQLQGVCGNCGFNKSRQQCPALGQECRLCKKLNHWAKCCRSKHTFKHVNFAEAVQSNDQYDSSSDENYVFSLNKTNSVSVFSRCKTI